MANELNAEKKTLAVSMLAEGNSIRSIERVTCAGVPGVPASSLFVVFRLSLWKRKMEM
jgi:hypothetical protein